MRIVFINQYFQPEPASTGQLLTDLAADLSLSNDVTVVTGFPSYTPEGSKRKRFRMLASERVGSARVIRTFTAGLARGRPLGRILNYLSFLCSSLLGALLLAGPADAVATMTDPPVVGLVGYLISRIRRARFVLVSQDVFPEVSEVLGVMDAGPVVRVLDRINRFLLARADRIVAIGGTMRRRLVEKGADPASITVIENWVDTDVVTPEDRINRFALRNDLCRAFVVMHSGNVGLSQELETLLDAARLMRSDPEVEFVIIGDGVSKADLIAKADRLMLDNVRFLPYQDRAVLRYSLASADLSVVSLKPGLAGYIVPSKLYGILASARPVLAAVEDECEVAETVRREKCGLVVEPGNPRQMVEAIRRMKSSPELLRQMGRRGRAAAETRYSRRLVVQRYAELFDEVYYTGRAAGNKKEDEEWILQTGTL
jgi:colanic acid biosynthesis glycosyl transferase WcaI